MLEAGVQARRIKFHTVKPTILCLSLNSASESRINNKDLIIDGKLFF